jgi:hypothetical protein
MVAVVNVEIARRPAIGSVEHSGALRRQLVAQELAHCLRVGFALRRLHHLPHEETQQLVFASAELSDLLWAIGNHLFNGDDQSILVADLSKPLFLHDVRGRFTGLIHGLEHRLRHGITDSAVVDSSTMIQLLTTLGCG